MLNLVLQKRVFIKNTLNIIKIISFNFILYVQKSIDIFITNTLSNFNRLFKKRKGCSPTEFREKYRKTKVIV